MKKLAGAAALGLTVLGVGVGMVGAASPAYAASLSQTQAAPANSASLMANILRANQTRDTTPVSFSSAQDVVDKFSAEQQLYVKGNPLTASEMAQMQNVLKQHPNMYVVLIDYASNYEDFDYTVSTGIGNSDAFQSVRNEETGEKEAAVFMVYFDSNGGRKIFMRSEELPDKLGVGEENFSDEYGNPLRLLRTFLRARDQGKNMPGMLEDVFKEVNGEIDKYVANLRTSATEAVHRGESEVPRLQDRYRDFNRQHPNAIPEPNFSGWQTQLQEAKAALDSGQFQQAIDKANGVIGAVGAANQAITGYEQTLATASQLMGQAERSLAQDKEALSKFQKDFGQGGQIGSPDVKGWEDQLKRAQDAMRAGDFDTAKSLASSLVNSISSHQQAMANFRQADALSDQVKAEVEQLQAALEKAPDNGHGQSAHRHFEAAQAALEQHEARVNGKTGDALAPLQTARSEAAAGLKDVEQAHSQEATTKRVILGVSSAVAIGTIALGIFANAKARARKKEAQQALRDATSDIQARTQALIELMDQADYQSIAQYSGKTEKMAKDLIENVTDALTLVGGAEKFLAEAEQLIAPNSPKNLFTTGNYDQAIQLLTDPEKRLPFNFEDSSRTVMEKGSKAESWREELLRKGASREFKKSLYEVLLAMAENRDTAAGLLHEIIEKNSEITQFLDTLEKSGREVDKKSEELAQKAGDDTRFTAPSVRDNLLAGVLSDAEQGGLIAKGRQVKDQDPVRAWEDFARPAERMIGDADKVVTTGQQLRESLVPIMDQAEQTLIPAGLKTDWATRREHALSERLDDTADTAVRVPLADQLEKISGEAAALGSQVKQVIGLDQERREVAPGQIEGAEKDISEARTDLHSKLQAMGVFQDGTPDQMLREEGRDPSERTQSAHQHHDGVAQSLNQGDVAGARQHLDSIRDLSQEAHGLVADSRAAFEAFPSTLDERKKRTVSIDDSIEASYEPALDRIQATYAPVVLELVAPDVNSGQTISDDIPNANQLLGMAREQTQTAVGHFDQAQLLTARDDLQTVDGTLRSAQSELDSVSGAEQLLAKKQAGNEQELEALGGRLDETRSHLDANFVRDPAKKLLAPAEAELKKAGGAVAAKPLNPYASAEALSQAEQARQAVESAIASDKNAFDSANSAIDRAGSAIASARSEISSAEGQSWSWSNPQGRASESVTRSDLSSAYSSLSAAEQALQAARGQMGSKAYEQAESQAESAISKASSAKSAAGSAVSSARSRFDSQKSRLERLQREHEERIRREEERRRAEQRRSEERRRDEQRRAEQRRAEQRRAEERRRSSSGSRGGSSGGGRRSGSRGGGW
ncbi:MAG: tetratricopeptide repeat protein [Vulcanimicrobiota bacterium]